jgi:hypothetical protein
MMFSLIISCYFSDNVCIVFVNMCLTQGDGQPFSLGDTFSVLLLSGHIGVCNGDSV